MFIELVSGVKYPKITTVGLFFLKRPFVDVLSSSRSFFAFCVFFVVIFFCVWIFSVCSFGKQVLSTFFSQCLVSRVKSPSLQSSLSRVFDTPLNSVFNPAQPQVSIPQYCSIAVLPVLVQKNQAKQKKFPEYEILKSKFVEKYFFYF